MEVILKHDVEKLGLKGEVVDVKRGYARNFLLPRQLAEVATPGRVAELERIEAERARHEARSAEQAADIAATLTKTVLRFEVKAGPTGALFGSVTPTDVAEELWRTRKIRVDRRKIDIDVIKRIGRFTIPIHVFEGVTAEVKTIVVPEGGDLPPEEELAALEAAERGGGRGRRARTPGSRCGQPRLRSPKRRQRWRPPARRRPRPSPGPSRPTRPRRSDRRALRGPLSFHRIVHTVHSAPPAAVEGHAKISARSDVRSAPAPAPSGENVSGAGDRMGTCVPFFLLPAGAGSGARLF